MMNFRVIGSNLKTILADGAAGRYQVVDHQVQGSDASEFIGNDRRVQVFYDGGAFPKGDASIQGPFQHDTRYNIWLTATAEAKMDLSVLNDVDSTPAQKKAALSASENAAARVNDSIDELFDIVFQVLMDGDNLDIGTVGLPHIVSDRWVPDLQKNQVQDFGEFVVLTGVTGFTCNVVETVSGDTGTASVEPVIDIENQIEGETDNQKTGLTI